MKPIIPTLPERESRFLPGRIELRAAAEGEEPKKVFGYAAVFNSRSENLGSASSQFFETIEPGAFDDVLKDDVRALFNHDPNAILARSKNGEGSLSLGIDDVGLWYEFEAPDTQHGRDLITSLKRKDVDQSSFSFTVSKEGQEWEESNDGEVTAYTRTIKKVSRLYDVSPVTYPAYPDATVALRSLADFQKAHAPEKPSQEELSEVSDWAARLGI